MPKRTQQLRDHEQVPLGNWKGLYSRGREDSAPLGYFIDSLNTSFVQNEVKTRDGSTKILTLDNIRRYFIYKRLNETSRYLILTTDGEFFDSLYPGTPLITDAGFLDFSAVNYLNRAYITFHNRVTGINGSYVYIYQGAGPGTLRQAAGAPPTGVSFSAPISLSSGNLSAGFYISMVAFETDSGFITAPGPETPAVTECPGGRQIGFDPVPTGPTGTVARRILISKGIPAALWAANPNPFGYELFFMPNGRIDDNTTTVWPGIDFFDDDLVDSADYLFDNRATLPSGLGLTVYNNRVVLYGVPGFEHHLFVSRAIEVEVFDETAGFVYLDPSDAISGVTNAVDMESTLYIQTSNRTYGVVGGDTDPDTWQPVSVDKAIGTSVFGISKILDSRGTSVKRFFQADPGGLYCFESGTFTDPAFSWNIEDLWKRINKAQFNKVVVAHDAKKYLVYAAVPLDSATECSHLLVGDYSNSFNRYGEIVSAMVRWNLWLFPGDITHIACDLDSNDQEILKLSLADNIYQMDSTVDTDDSTKISSYVQLAFIEKVKGQQHHFGNLVLDVTGVGDLVATYWGYNRQKSVSIPAFALSLTSQFEQQKPANFVNSKMSIKLTCNTNAGDKFNLLNGTVDVKPLWAETPNV